MKGLLTVVLAVVGIALVVVSIIYFVEPAHSLPSFFPAHSSVSTHAVKHGIAALVVGLIALALAAVLGRRGSRAHARTR